MKSVIKTFSLLAVIAIVVFSCKKRDDTTTSDGGTPFQATPYEFAVPEGFPQFAVVDPPNNPMTVEGVRLGRKLFYEKRLSADNTMSCASCHNQAFAFTDNGNKVSVGIDNIAGTRNAMAIINMAWSRNLFWDGRRHTLEEQAHDPVVDPIEMHSTWPQVAKKLKDDAEYKQLFNNAFGSEKIDSVGITRAIAQFERSLVSSNSRFDKFMRGEIKLTPQEDLGRRLFMQDRTSTSSGADCFHCHGGTANILLTDDIFHNNGLDVFPKDSGLAKVTKDPKDLGKFKTPTLRNVSLTGPYMHDGRFETLEEVVDFYSDGLQKSPTIDPLMKNVDINGVQLQQFEKDALIAFLKTFTDSSFINNPDFSDPGQ